MSYVALRKESVDRNYIIKITDNRPAASLSARRAWIEIDIPPNLDADRAVALRKESVDRNKKSKTEKQKLKTSLSARRAWIEIGLSDGD